MTKLFFIRRELRKVSRMAAVAGSAYARSNLGKEPKFGMEMGTRVRPGQIFIKGRYIDQAEFFKVS